MKEEHPLTSYIPQRANFDDLLMDIAQSGLREPVVLYEGKIVEGRVRYKATLELGRRTRGGVQPTFKDWVLIAEGAPLDWMVKKHVDDHPQTELDLIKLVLALLPEYRQRRGSTHGMLYRITGLSWNKIRTLDWLDQAGKIEKVVNGELGVFEAGRKYGFIQEKRTLTSPGINFGMGDPFDEAIQPLKKYLDSWDKKGFEFRHLNPREASRRLVIIDRLVDALARARVDIEKRSHAATLSAPPERKERR